MCWTTRRCIQAGCRDQEFLFCLFYECGVATYVDNLPPGGKVTVFDQATAGGTGLTIGGASGVEGGQSIGIGPPFVKDHFVSAQGEICGDKSPFSVEQQVQARPGTIPGPQTTGLYENGQLITVNHLVNGSRVTIKASALFGGGGAPADHVRFWLSRPLNSGESSRNKPGVVSRQCGNRNRNGAALFGFAGAAYSRRSRVMK